MRRVLFILGLTALAGCASSEMPGPGTGDEFRDCAECPDMVVIPAGSFSMGSPDGEEGRSELPVRQVSVPRFAAAKYEVTQAEFEAFVAATGYEVGRGCEIVEMGASLIETEDKDWRDPGYQRAVRPDDPVVCVGWTDAKAYTAWLSEKAGLPYRLLTEAEWEYVAKGGAETPWYWGDDPAEGCAHANMYDQTSADKWNLRWSPVACTDGHEEVAPVGSFPASPFGLHDILGNVWEWVEDCYVMPYPDGPVDGSAVQVEGMCDRRSVRGGSWITRASRHRASFRGRDPEPTLFNFFGFRVARDVN